MDNSLRRLALLLFVFGGASVLLTGCGEDEKSKADLIADMNESLGAACRNAASCIPRLTESSCKAGFSDEFLTFMNAEDTSKLRSCIRAATKNYDCQMTMDCADFAKATNEQAHKCSHAELDAEIACAAAFK